MGEKGEYTLWLSCEGCTMLKTVTAGSLVSARKKATAGWVMLRGEIERQILWGKPPPWRCPDCRKIGEGKAS